MKLTKETLRGVIKEVLKEANGDEPATTTTGEPGLRAGEREKVGKGASVQTARVGQKEFAGSSEVTVPEVDVLEAVVARLREIAAAPGVNMAGGSMIQVLERMLKLLGLKAKGGLEADSPAPDSPDA